MKKVVASVVLGMSMFAGVGTMYMANTGCHKGNACQELVKKACKDADKDKKQAYICNMWKQKVENGMDESTCEANLRHMK